MTSAYLLWANLTRKGTRSTLTFLSVAIAFLLFMLLRSIAGAFSGAVSTDGMSRLIVDAKYSMTDNLPLAYVQQIQALDDVDVATNLSWFGGYYQDPKNSFAKYPVDPISYFDVYREFVIDPDVLERFANTRVGAVASKSLAARYGWHVGDIIPITGDIWPKEDGSWSWQFELVGTFDFGDNQPDVPLFLLRYDYFNESVASWAKDQVGWIAARVKGPERIDAAIRAIDSRYENSSDPVRSTTEDEYQRQYARQIGDVGTITSMILGAVFFTILLLTGNTAAQSLTERLPELAVMKTLGFSNRRIAELVIAEAMLLCVGGALVGIGLALLLQPYLNARLSSLLGRFQMDAASAVTAIGVALALSVAIGARPAWAAYRLAIADALRVR